MRPLLFTLLMLAAGSCWGQIDTTTWFNMQHGTLTFNIPRVSFPITSGYGVFRMHGDTLLIDNSDNFHPVVHWIKTKDMTLDIQWVDLNDSGLWINFGNNKPDSAFAQFKQRKGIVIEDEVYCSCKTICCKDSLPDIELHPHSGLFVKGFGPSTPKGQINNHPKKAQKVEILPVFPKLVHPKLTNGASSLIPIDITDSIRGLHPIEGGKP